MKGIPKLTEFNFLNWNGGGGHVGFSPVSPITGKDAIKQYRMVSGRVREYGFDYMGLFAIGWRELHHVTVIVYNKNNPDERQKLDELFNLMVDEAASEGYGEYRTHIRYMDRSRPPMAGTTMRSGRCTRRSRMRSIPTASSRPANPASGPRTGGRNDDQGNSCRGRPA